MNFSYKKINSELPNGWTFIRISEIARVNSETVNKSYKNDFIHYIDISSVSTGVFESPKLLSLKDAPSRAKRILKEGDIIISTVRPNLRQYSLLEGVGSNWVASTGFAVVRANEEKFKWYLYSFLTSSVFNDYLVRVADGAAYPTFNPKEIEEAEIPLPDEQSLEVISNLARVINQKIKTNNNMNQILEKLAQTIFRSWFIDFDPVYAKKLALEKGLTSTQAERAAMAIISGVCSPTDFAENYEEMDQKLSAKLSKMNKEKVEELALTASLFPGVFEDSELGAIPKGWSLTNIEEISHLTSSKRIKAAEYVQEGIPFYRSKEIINKVNRQNVKTELFISHERYNEIKDKFDIPKSNDLLITAVGTLGKVYRVKESDEFYFKDGNLIWFKPKSEEYSTLLFYFLTSNFGKTELEKTVIGSTQAAYTISNLNRVKLIVPSEGLQKIYNSLAIKLEALINNNIDEIFNLETLRDSLLPKLLAGEINLSNIEIGDDL